jgi:hypothetical protein
MPRSTGHGTRQREYRAKRNILAAGAGCPGRDLPAHSLRSSGTFVRQAKTERDPENRLCSLARHAQSTRTRAANGRLESNRAPIAPESYPGSAISRMGIGCPTSIGTELRKDNIRPNRSNEGSIAEKVAEMLNAFPEDFPRPRTPVDFR